MENIKDKISGTGLIKRPQEKDAAAYALGADKINVLLMGTSGAGKSTLINAILPGAGAPTGSGGSVTREMKPYTADGMPLTLIDTVGYEYNLLRQLNMKQQLSKWTKDGVKKEDASKLVHMIWFCVDGQNKRVFTEVLDSIRGVTKFWKDIPIVVVFTKSYGSEEEDRENVRMFMEVLNSYRHKKDLNIREKDIIPVVAKEYTSAAGVVPVKGLDQLVSRTMERIPEASKAVEKAVRNVVWEIRRGEARGYVAAGTAAAAAIGAIPIDFPDATLLVPLQSYMLGQITRVYGAGSKDAAKNIIEAVMKVSATTLVGKALLNKLKLVPGIGSLSGAILNAFVAGLVTCAAGETSIILYDRINRGELLIDENVNWMPLVTEIFNSRLPFILDAFTKNQGKLDIKNISSSLASIAKNYLEAAEKKNGNKDRS